MTQRHRLIGLVAVVFIALGCASESADELFTRGEEATHDVAHYGEAITNLEAFLAQYPNDTRADVALQALARVYQSRKEGDLSIAKYQELIRRFPGSRYADQAQFMIGYIHDLSGRKAEAIAAYGEVIATYPKSDLVDDARVSIANIDKPLESWIFPQNDSIEP